MPLRIFTIVILVIVIGYGLREALPLITGPQLVINEPKNSGIFYNSFINISGTAVHTQSVSLNGGPLLTDQNGRFQTTLTLPHGGAILTLTATDRFGRSTTERRTVFVP
jgi:hypothetical protein